MTEQEITALGPAFASYLRRFRGCLGQDRTAAHFDTYCRGLLTDLPRKTVEPIALEAGTAVRTLQEFLVTARWDHAAAGDTLRTHLRGSSPTSRPTRSGRSGWWTRRVAASGATTRRGCSGSTSGASARSTAAS